MPDDDYEVVRVGCGCASCAKINDETEKKKEIKRLLIGMETREKGPLYATPWIWYIGQIIKVLKRMNDIE